MSLLEPLARLRRTAPIVLPSLLLCDFGNLAREVERLEAAGVQALHLDVMDGNFVPNLTYGLPIVAALRKLTRLPLDTHLMIANPLDYVERFQQAGSDIVTIHVEAVPDPREALQRIGELGVGAGIALNPLTPVSKIEGCLDVADLVLVMSVEAGFGGQEFMPVALEKLRRVRQLAGPDTLLEVDGGINDATIRPCGQAGAQLFVVGSAILRQSDYGPVVERLTTLAEVN